MVKAGLEGSFSELGRFSFLAATRMMMMIVVTKIEDLAEWMTRRCSELPNNGVDLNNKIRGKKGKRGEKRRIALPLNGRFEDF
ncbi:hypothetical protein K0M31_018793 [Melipona bicolor]|uniref:Uncharacterized protein n=1 Tax=Melipona bicolor TaxID=60889 RepID=A0AA40G4A6_9HYME|nr:hypothetical protein K0M31_018793 [Melipona bicolor]